MNDVSTINVLRFKNEKWKSFPRQRVYVSSSFGRSIECVRLCLVDAVERQRLSLLDSNRWPLPPDLTSIPESLREKLLNFNFLLSQVEIL